LTTARKNRSMSPEDSAKMRGMFLSPDRLYEPLVGRRGVAFATSELAAFVSLLRNGKSVTVKHMPDLRTWHCNISTGEIGWTDTLQGEKVPRWMAAAILLHEWGHFVFTTPYDSPVGVDGHQFHWLMNGGEDPRMERQVAEVIPGFAAIAGISARSAFDARLASKTPVPSNAVMFVSLCLMAQHSGNGDAWLRHAMANPPAPHLPQVVLDSASDFAAAVAADTTDDMVPWMHRIYQRIVNPTPGGTSGEGDDTDTTYGDPGPGDGDGEGEGEDTTSGEGGEGDGDDTSGEGDESGDGDGTSGEGDGDGGSDGGSGSGDDTDQSVCRCGKCGQRIPDPEPAYCFAVAVPDVCEECGQIVNTSGEDGDGGDGGEGGEGDPAPENPERIGVSTEIATQFDPELRTAAQHAKSAFEYEQDEDRHQQQQVDRALPVRSQADVAKPDDVRLVSSRLTRGLRRVLTDNEAGTFMRDETSGRLDGARVMQRIRQGRMDFYRERSAPKGITDWSVITVCDVSGSTGGIAGWYDGITSEEAAERGTVGDHIRTVAMSMFQSSAAIHGVDAAAVFYDGGIRGFIPFGTAAPKAMRQVQSMYSSGGTDEAPALALARSLSEAHGSTGQIIVVLTDGTTSAKDRAEAEARKCREQGILTVGIGVATPAPKYHPVRRTIEDPLDLGTVVPEVIRSMMRGER
jgi:uncharacterized membrane protein YgcG